MAMFGFLQKKSDEDKPKKELGHTGKGSKSVEEKDLVTSQTKSQGNLPEKTQSSEKSKESDKTQPKAGKPVAEKDSGQKIKRQSINLIPGPTEEEIVVEETKTKRSISGFLFIALVVFLAVVVLGFNLWTKIRLNNAQQDLAETENEISLKQLEELQQKNLNNKLDAFKAVKDQDFNSDRVLEYLLEVTDGLSDVKTLYLDNTMKFEIRGTATSYTNVARLWHDMSREEDYFESISLDRVSRSADSGSVQFVFSGFMIRDQVVTL
jgi:hypothetical protein